MLSAAGRLIRAPPQHLSLARRTPGILGLLIDIQKRSGSLPAAEISEVIECNHSVLVGEIPAQALPAEPIYVLGLRSGGALSVGREVTSRLS